MALPSLVVKSSPSFQSSLVALSEHSSILHEEGASDSICSSISMKALPMSCVVNITRKVNLPRIKSIFEPEAQHDDIDEGKISLRKYRQF